MNHYFKKNRHLQYFWRLTYILIVVLSFCISCETGGKERLEKLCSIDKLNKYSSFSISPSGDYILMQGPSDETAAQTPEGSEFVPGGMKRLYNKQGSLIWKKMYAGYLDFCANEVYLIEPSSAEFEGPLPPTIYYRKDGSLFFRMPKEYPEVNSFDVSPRGDMVLVGEMFSDKIMLIHKGKKVWDYLTGISGFVDVVFSQDGAFFMVNKKDTLFSVDNHGVVHKIDVPVVKKNLLFFNRSDLKDSVYFVFVLSNSIFKYRPKENKLFSLDLSTVEKSKRKFVIKELSRNYHIQPIKIIFSTFLDHVGVTTDDAFYYFEIREE
jgi:hypothetical protein